MATEYQIVNAILQRRSVSPRRLVAPGPDDSQLRLLIEAAAAAPDHGRIHPWRFVAVGERDRAQLAKVFREAAHELDAGATEDALQREAEKAHNAPCLIAVIARIDENHPVAPVTEQWVSVGAALQNILLAAENLGFHAMMVSGRKVTASAMRKAFELAINEHLVGFVSIGSANPEPRDTKRAKVDEVLTSWKPKMAE
jgi:nitroreductase